MSEITLDKVTKRFPDGTEAVKQLDLEVADGEFLILVGPSGCGKSTALRMIAGLEDISEGELRIGEDVVNGKAPKDRDIAMVFQNYALYPHMTVRENMAFPLKMAKVDQARIDEMVEKAAQILDLTEHLDRKPSNLSGGQRQRVAMGRAIVREPKAFLMDEPLSNLDAKLRVQMRAEVSRIQNRLETTTVYVTHDQTEAMTLGDRVAVMRKGELQQVGSPQELYDHPVNLFVAGFIGSPAMNFMPVEVSGRNAKLPFCEVEITEAMAKALESHAAGNLMAGIRPEHFEDAKLVGEPAGPALRGRGGDPRIDGLGALRLLRYRRRGPRRAARRAGGGHRCRVVGRLRAARRPSRCDQRRQARREGRAVDGRDEAPLLRPRVRRTDRPRGRARDLRALTAARPRSALAVQSRAARRRAITSSSHSCVRRSM